MKHTMMDNKKWNIAADALFNAHIIKLESENQRLNEALKNIGPMMNENTTRADEINSRLQDDNQRMREEIEGSKLMLKGAHRIHNDLQIQNTVNTDKLKAEIAFLKHALEQEAINLQEHVEYEKELLSTNNKLATENADLNHKHNNIKHHNTMLANALAVVSDKAKAEIASLQDQLDKAKITILNREDIIQNKSDTIQWYINREHNKTVPDTSKLEKDLADQKKRADDLIEALRLTQNHVVRLTKEKETLKNNMRKAIESV